MSLKRPWLLSRHRIYHFCYFRFRVLHCRSLKLLKTEPYVLLLADVENAPLEGVVLQGPKEDVLFDWPPLQERVTLLLSGVGTQCPRHRF